jgi:hypothetical protein
MVEWKKLHSLLLILLREINHVHASCMGDTGNAYTILIGKFHGKIPLGRSSCRQEVEEV